MSPSFLRSAKKTNCSARRHQCSNVLARGRSDELLALNDPTLFALPHPAGFRVRRLAENAGQTAAVPLDGIAALAAAARRWKLGATFARFMRTNYFAANSLDFKPEPELSDARSAR
jgi:hypothetical protein